MTKLWEQVMREATGGILPGRNDLPSILLAAEQAGRFDNESARLAEAIDDAWQMCELPMHALDADDWSYLFGVVGFIDNGIIATLPTEVPVLYRAAAEGYELGMSWTEDPKTALFFYDRNERFGLRPSLLKLDPLTGFDRYQVAARIHGEGSRDEHEWVVDSRHLSQAPTAISPTQLREMDQ